MMEQQFGSDTLQNILIDSWQMTEQQFGSDTLQNVLTDS
jgi:lambda repressor-like predicted transcriptional regulator